jgi:RNA-directed DNA polymerase
LAAKLVLEPIFEADFEPNAYGYRPGRGALDAVQEVNESIRRGESHVVDADLSKYFDTIPHRELMRSVARRITDQKVLHLIKMWLKVPVEGKDEEGRTVRTGGKKTKEGTPQGGVISPLLANIYIHRLLRARKKFDLERRLRARIINYADDLVIVSQGRAEEALNWLRWIIERLGLRLNEEKTCVRDARRESFDAGNFGDSPQRQSGWVAARLRPKMCKWTRRCSRASFAALGSAASFGGRAP